MQQTSTVKTAVPCHGEVVGLTTYAVMVVGPISWSSLHTTRQLDATDLNCRRVQQKGASLERPL